MVTRRPGTAALLALTMLSVQPTSAYAQALAPSAGALPTAAPPIKIESSSSVTGGGKAPRTWLALQFRNEAKVAADEVRFVVRYNGSDNEIVDKGLFSPGTLIVHRFIAGQLVGFRDPRDCSVSYVHFMDGTHWESGPLERSRPQGQQPPNR